MYQEIEGDLITLAKEGKFDVIAHGCNCQCVMGAGIAVQMAKAFGCDTLFTKENIAFRGSVEKLGNIEFKTFRLVGNTPLLADFPLQNELKYLTVVNAYTQFMYGKNHTNGVDKPLDYEALTLCLRKINHIFKGKHIGLPLIGCHLAGGVWDKTTQEGLLYHGYLDVKTIIQQELKDMEVTIVHWRL